jgi:hypothetical protein
MLKNQSQVLPGRFADARIQKQKPSVAEDESGAEGVRIDQQRDGAEHKRQQQILRARRKTLGARLGPANGWCGDGSLARFHEAMTTGSFIRRILATR